MRKPARKPSPPTGESDEIERPSEPIAYGDLSAVQPMLAGIPLLTVALVREWG